MTAAHPSHAGLRDVLPFDYRFGAWYYCHDLRYGRHSFVVVADTWRPIMNKYDSDESFVTNLRNISTCPLSFY